MNVTDKEWLNFRSTYFTRKRKRELDTLAKYGGVEPVNEHGRAGGWRAMLKMCEEQHLGNIDEDESYFTIKWSMNGSLFLAAKIHVSKEAPDAYAALAPE